MKLLHWGIKPVFVFDGDAPMLKKRTIVRSLTSLSLSLSLSLALPEADTGLAIIGETQEKEGRSWKGSRKDCSTTLVCSIEEPCSRECSFEVSRSFSIILVL